MPLTLLEQTRAAHEEIERFERSIVKDLHNQPPSYKDRLYQTHRVRQLIHQITSTTHKLVEIYEDRDNARKDEIAALDGETAVGATVLSAFYDQLKEIREYYKRHPSALVVDTTTDHKYMQLLDEDPYIEFSQEEAYGRYLDMHELYHDYIKSEFGKQIDYSDYLEVFSQSQHIPQKLRRLYREYLSKMVTYLVSFLERTEPLQDLDRLFSKVTAEFEEQWADGKVDGWKGEAREDRYAYEQNTSIDLDYYITTNELVELGPVVAQHQNDDSKQIALMKVKIDKLCEILSEKIIRTKENVVRKQGQLHEEMEVEGEDEELPDIESDDEDQQIYNPLKLPMSWDGKPIPFWLYNLHGLNKEFMCEICGDFSYRGRRAYEHHFKESRHQFGMRRLGIPNTKSFYEIASIEEAQRLWEMIKAKQESKKWRPDLEEEFEDQDGNVYNKKTYDDLQRQGLI
ncbi:hypothetical protein SSX86_005535 [Deinandra increscens subsp. villosa]|uniref:Matrin-type domain-containing protein n=1 Tax=Deinandra increscens subsp. villosa TaxID=3103831 RepID=A0AAP0DU36_9ASTR